MTRLCRGCFQKIQNCISFRQEAVTNLLKFRDGYQQSKKRMANFSPDLDLSAAVAVHADTSVEDSLQLCIMPGPSVKEDRAKSKDEDFSPLYLKPTNNIDNEHGYTRPRTNGKAVCKELFPVPINRDVPDQSMNPINANKNFLKVITNECMQVSTKRQGEQSVLMRKKSMESLADENTDMTREILEEMKDRTPSLLELLEATLVNIKTADEKIKEAIALVYGVIMFTRNPELSAYQRLITALCIRGRAEDMLEDTAKEGNLSMVLPNLKVCIPIFYQHSCLSKYMVECIDYLMKVNYYMSPIDSLRILEGSFVNLRGGVGNNVEADLVQEHSVRNQKDLIRGLGANKTENAISSVTAAAPIITSICRNFDSQHDITKKGNRHTKHISEEDVNILKKSLRKLRPFKVTTGRKCRSFNHITNSPAGRVDVNKMEIDINRIVERLGRGLAQNDDNEDEDDDDDDDDDDEDTDSDLPDIP
ncbi:Hypothetical predicted protein [Mytilus galloprovincialis]|uniref:DUF6589 domain-containing protein n=1 Tax=Mytilus galloprovincialis TaxID=29158 RepID=A0A8B6DQ40_MYTGA|nr:Hypothetical predicted protein [Mytilus galloprovincialis]